MKYRVNFKNSILFFLILGVILTLFYTVVVVILLKNGYLPLFGFLFTLMFPALIILAVIGSFSWQLYLDDATIRISAIGAKVIFVPYKNIISITPRNDNYFIKGGHGPRKGNFLIWYREGYKEELENICFGLNQENFSDFIEIIKRKNSKISIQSPFV
jgi:hypothetical protein